MDYTGVKQVGNNYLAIKNGQQVANMFYDKELGRWEVWSKYEYDPIRYYKTLSGGLGI